MCWVWHESWANQIVPLHETTPEGEGRKRGRGEWEGRGKGRGEWEGRGQPTALCGTDCDTVIG